MLRNAMTPVWLLSGIALLALASCSPPYETGMARGKQEFRTCVPCHGAHGGGNRDLGAPAIAGLPDWYLVTQLAKFKNGMRGTNPDDTTGAQMRAMSLTLADSSAMRDVIAFIRSLSH